MTASLDDTARPHHHEILIRSEAVDELEHLEMTAPTLADVVARLHHIEIVQELEPMRSLILGLTPLMTNPNWSSWRTIPASSRYSADCDLPCTDSRTSPPGRQSRRSSASHCS